MSLLAESLSFETMDELKMRKPLLFLPLCCLMALAACRPGDEASGACDLRVEIALPGYTEVCLMTPEGCPTDTLQVDAEGRAILTWPDTAVMPRLLLLHLENPADSTDILNMPFVVEPGRVNVSIGRYIRTEGTPLNQRLQHFLDALQALHDEWAGRNDLSQAVKDAQASAFFSQQMLLNKDNPVGHYLYSRYANRLNQEDRERVKAEMFN